MPFTYAPEQQKKSSEIEEPPNAYPRAVLRCALGETILNEWIIRVFAQTTFILFLSQFGSNRIDHPLGERDDETRELQCDRHEVKETNLTLGAQALTLRPAHFAQQGVSHIARAQARGRVQRTSRKGFTGQLSRQVTGIWLDATQQGAFLCSLAFENKLTETI